MSKLDDTDKRILRILQQDATLTSDEISQRVNLSRNACWRRIRAMEESGIIRARVALADPVAVGCPLEAVVLLRTSQHEAGWLETFQAALNSLPEVVGAYRMTGDLDYLLRVRVADVPAYDAFYKKLTKQLALSDISASFVMEELKETTALPLG